MDDINKKRGVDIWWEWRKDKKFENFIGFLISHLKETDKNIFWLKFRDVTWYSSLIIIILKFWILEQEKKKIVSIFLFSSRFLLTSCLDSPSSPLHHLVLACPVAAAVAQCISLSRRLVVKKYKKSNWKLYVWWDARGATIDTVPNTRNRSKLKTRTRKNHFNSLSVCCWRK